MTLGIIVHVWTPGKPFREPDTGSFWCLFRTRMTFQFLTCIFTFSRIYFDYWTPLLDCSVVLAHVKHDDWWHPESRACCTGGPPGLHVYLMLLVMPIDFLKRLTEWKKNSSITTQSTPDLLSNWPKLTIIVNGILFTIKDFNNENTVIWNYKVYPIKSLSLKNCIRFIFVESAFESNSEFWLINQLYLPNKIYSTVQVEKISTK